MKRMAFFITVVTAGLLLTSCAGTVKYCSTGTAMPDTGQGSRLVECPDDQAE